MLFDQAAVYPDEGDLKEDIIYYNDNVDTALDKFRRAHGTGTSMQMAGVGLVIASVLLQQLTENNDDDVVIGVAAAGSLVWIIGLGVESGAGKHLRTMQKH